MKSPDQTKLTPDNIVAFLENIFIRHGAISYLGEQVTTSEHMLQGALLAEEANAPDALIAGVLLHDIGHYIHEFSHAAFVQGIDDYHDKVGAALLAPFSQQWSQLALDAMLRPNVISAQPNQTILIGCHRHRFIRCACRVAR